MPKCTLVNNTWGKEKILREILKYFELSKNENTTYPNLWDVVKTVFREKFIPLIHILVKKKDWKPILGFH